MPYRYVKYVVVVPRTLETASMDWQSVIRSPLFCVWSTMIFLFTALRKLLQHFAGPTDTISDIFFDTFAMSFGMAGHRRIHNRPERILLTFLYFVAMLAGIICSGMLFNQFTMAQGKASINTLKELEASKLPIMMPDCFGPGVIKWWNNSFVLISWVGDFSLFYLFSG